MKLSVVIVSYNVKFYLVQCLRSLQKALKNIDSEIIIVDNSSSDGSVEYFSMHYPDVKIISSSLNLGFAKANNVAINQSSGEYVLLLNPDTIVGETTIQDVISFMDIHKNAGGVGVRMIKSDGSDAMESRRGIPSPITSFYKVSGLCAHFPRSKRFAHYYMGGIPWDSPARIEIISGAFCMLRHEAVRRVGLLDEDFFMYGEDIDLSYRLLKGGYENWYVPAKILHYKGESTEKSSFRYVHTFYKAMLIFFRKHYGEAGFLISIPVTAAIYFKALCSLFGMMTTWMRENLGFSSVSHRNSSPFYVFIGSPESAAYMNLLAKNNGMNIKTYIGDEQTLPQGHLSVEIPSGGRVYVVYDVSAYSYTSMFSLFSQSSSRGFSLGTFDIHTHTIITADSVIR